jgi:hypothetical protein
VIFLETWICDYGRLRRGGSYLCRHSARPPEEYRRCRKIGQSETTYEGVDIVVRSCPVTVLIQSFQTLVLIGEGNSVRSLIVILLNRLRSWKSKFRHRQEFMNLIGKVCVAVYCVAWFSRLSRRTAEAFRRNSGHLRCHMQRYLVVAVSEIHHNVQ